jgi:DNA topoisomerase-1
MRARKKVTKEPTIKKKSPKVKAEGDDNVYKWWREDQADNGVKWTTLGNSLYNQEHNGPWFPEAYVPHGIMLKYNGETIPLSPEEEEVASFFAAIIGTDFEHNPTFVHNFFTNFKEVLSKVCKFHNLIIIISFRF